MEVKETTFENYGNCVYVSNGIIEAVVTIDCGPRIIRLGFNGERNVLYNDLERKYFLSVNGLEGNEDGGIFYYYGGHRLWLCSSRSAHLPIFRPDNSSVIYSVHSDGVQFTSAKQKQSEIETGFELVMGDDAADIMIVHTAKNLTKEPLVFGLRPVTMFTAGGIMILPQSSDQTSLLNPNRSISLWPGTDIHDAQIHWGNRFITIGHGSGESNPLKLGISNPLGWGVYAMNDFTIMKHYVYTPQAPYADFDSSFEAGFRDDFVEMETLSPIFRVEPGQGIRHVENLSLFHTTNLVNPSNEDSVAQFIERLK